MAAQFSQQVRELEAGLRERDDELEERDRLLARAKGALEVLSTELERTRREAEASQAQVRCRHGWLCPACG